MSGKYRLLGAILLGLQLPGSVALAAADNAEPWGNDAARKPVEENQAGLSDNSAGNFSSGELADALFKALAEMEEKYADSQPAEFALLVRLEVTDEVQLKLAREQEHYAHRNMSKVKANDASISPEFAAQEYADAKGRAEEMEAFLQRVREKKEQLLQAMSGKGGAAGSPAANAAVAPRLQQARDQEAEAGHKLDIARTRAKSVSEMFVRHSLEGDNRLDKMKPMKERYEEAQQKLEQAAREYARARRKLTALEEGRPMPADSNQEEGELELGSSFDEIYASWQLSPNLPLKNVPDYRFRVYTELRIDSGHSGGEHGTGSRTRVRARIYPDYNIDGNWHIKGMVEYEKALSGRKGSSDGKVKLNRYYLSGDIGTVHTDIGAFSSTMAEGNIYDSKFEGIRLSTGKPVRYTLEAGRVGHDGVKYTYDLTASYDGAAYGLDAGLYGFGFKGGGRQNVYMLNYRHSLGVLDAGVMALYGKESGKGGKAGYVVTLGYTPKDNWKPYTWSGWLKYYYQPTSTYLAHTMNGLADVLKLHGGFRGFGLGISYNLPHDWSLNLEYYALRDLYFGHSANTIWGSMTKGFGNQF